MVQDISLNRVNLVVLEKGQVIGIEECETLKNPMKRTQNVKCTSNNSKVWFLK